MGLTNVLPTEFNRCLLHDLHQVELKHDMYMTTNAYQVSSKGENDI